jgi:thiamine kinase-like enzyme
MSIESIVSRKEVASFLERNNWTPVQAVGFGYTGYVLIIERDSEKYALKIARNEDRVGTLSTEFQLLQYLNNTPLKSQVPEVGEWLEEVGGFLMEYLISPAPEEVRGETWLPRLAHALRRMHNTELPDIKGIPDDRPNISRSISKRFTDFFNIVLNGDDYWISLPEAERPKLEIVRQHHQKYSTLIPDVENALINTRPALTHGDLAGDNIMLKPDGTLVFIDWEGARISSPLCDVACVLSYINRSEEEIERFLEEYFGSRKKLEEFLPCIQGLHNLYRYRNCVGSLWWLNERAETGLDAVGMAYFNRVLAEL